MSSCNGINLKALKTFVGLTLSCFEWGPMSVGLSWVRGWCDSCGLAFSWRIMQMPNGMMAMKVMPMQRTHIAWRTVDSVAAGSTVAVHCLIFAVHYTSGCRWRIHFRIIVEMVVKLISIQIRVRNAIFYIINAIVIHREVLHIASETQRGTRIRTIYLVY